jgi:hypothetical protein
LKSVKIKVNNTTISINDYVLEHYSQHFFKSAYADNKKFINAQIRNLISYDAIEKNVSQEVTKFLIDTIILDGGKKI